MGGLLTRAIKARSRRARDLRGALSAHAMEEHKQSALQAGCDDYDTKPVDLPRLLAKINAALGR